jgi:hypothetical protein
MDMEKSVFTISILIVMALSVQAQEVNDLSRKFGKITDYELTMTSYEQDPSAQAVVLYEDVKIRYVYDYRVGFKQLYYYSVKIKILNTDASGWADVEIPYYKDKEFVGGINATTYNLENGKVVKSSLGSKYIFREQVVDDKYLLKFSLPNVKAGSVIEYKYNISSDYVASIPTITMQKSIPIMYSHAEVEVPEYFRFTVNTKGYERVNVNKTISTGTILFPDGERLSFINNTVTCEASNVPALKSESYVWCIDDYLTAVEFELSDIVFPNMPTKSFASSWGDVNSALDESSFSNSLRFNNPFKDETASILATYQSDEDKLRAIHRLVMSRIAWNGKYYLLSGDTHSAVSNIRTAIKNGVGNSAEINFALHSVLKAAGYEVTPILLNPRQFGRLPISRPSIDAINAFVLMVTLPDGRSIILDGTDRYSDLNLLPPQLMVNRARIYGLNGENGWIDLTELSPNGIQQHINGYIDEQGMLHGEMSATYYGLEGYRVKRDYNNATSQDEFLADKENEEHIKISEYTVDGLDSRVVQENYKFTRQLDVVGGIIYIPAEVQIFMEENPLNQQERVLPVEYSYPVNVQSSTSIRLPQGYVAEEIPEPVRISAADNGMSYSYLIQLNSYFMQTRNTFTRNRIIYLPSEYPNLYQFMGEVVNTGTQRIVLSKAE